MLTLPKTRAENWTPPTPPPWRAPVIAGALAVVLAVVYLLAPPTGQDLAAQLFRADFARHHPLTPVDLRWFGGTSALGYSLWAPLAMSFVGVRLTGALCSVAATVLTTLLFRRGCAARPLFGGLLAALTQTVDLVAGRTTFAVGMVCGLAALLLLPDRHQHVSRTRWVGVALLALLCGGASAVAALLLWVGLAALFATGSYRRAVVPFVASLVPVLVTGLLFGTGGTQTFAVGSLWSATAATAVVAVLVPNRLVRSGAVVGLILLFGSFLVSSPVGDNSLRLSFLFAAPVVGAFAAAPPARAWLAVVAVAAAALPQQVDSRFSFSHGPSGYASYYAPLLHEIHRRGPVTGRVEIPETEAHWGAYYVGRDVPLARGWLRQVDFARNRKTLFTTPFSVAAYHRFLRANAVQYVALPDANVSASGRRERDNVRAGLPYLRRVWGNEHWSLWAVRNPVPIVSTPGRLVSMSASSITFDAAADTTTRLAVRPSRWLTVTSGSGCLAPSGHGFVVRTSTGGRIVIGSRLHDVSSGRCQTGRGPLP